MEIRIFEVSDVIALLQREVESAGGQSAWSRKTGVDRSAVNLVLKGRRELTVAIIAALNLRMVFVPGADNRAPPRQSRRR
jgi:antitoxin component HigA of HigAB toxin-antitoxin module